MHIYTRGLIPFFYFFFLILHCILDVFLSLGGGIIPNHGYAIISDIGSTDDTALLCNTNRPPNGLSSGGNWFGPDGTRVGDTFNGEDNVAGYIRDRDPMVVRLRRNTATDPPAEGIFQCQIEDATFLFQTVYVGLYSTEGGMIGS